MTGVQTCALPISYRQHYRKHHRNNNIDFSAHVLLPFHIVSLRWSQIPAILRIPPVSYTHLDVYKRQTHSLSLKSMSSRFSNTISPTRIPDEALEMMRDNCTELRDLAMIDMLASTGMRVGEMVLLNRCLLYTSFLYSGKCRGRSL